ncbi:hypothetical protein BMT61_24465, partial [Escherichia coli]
IMLPSETMIWQPEFTDKTLSRKPGAVHPLNTDDTCRNYRAAFGKRTILYGCVIAVGCTPTLYGLWQTFREMR